MVEMIDHHVDGNGLAGPLSELFTMDMTNVRGRCAGCGNEATLAQAMLFDRGPGLVARCSACGAVLVRIVRAPNRAFLDLRGVTCLELPMPGA
jgi:ribosomal protein S27E